jgi:hypothetical protein
MRTRAAFHEDGSDFDFGGAAEVRRDAARSRFRVTVAGLEKAWPIEFRHNPFHPLVTWRKPARS